MTDRSISQQIVADAFDPNGWDEIDSAAPLERAGRALFDVATEQMGADAGGSHAIEDQWVAMREYYKTRARAVLQAIREPSWEMTLAGIGEPFDPLSNDEAIDVWQAMIDAALEEG